MEDINGIYEVNSNGVRLMINITDKISFAFKKGNEIGILSLNKLQVEQLIKDWKTLNPNTLKGFSANEAKLSERNHELFEKVFNQQITMMAVHNSLDAIQRNSKNNIDGMSKQLIEDLKTSLDEEISSFIRD